MSVFNRLGRLAQGKGKVLAKDAREGIESLAENLASAFSSEDDDGNDREAVLEQELAAHARPRDVVASEARDKLALLQRMHTNGLLSDDEFGEKAARLRGDDPTRVERRDLAEPAAEESSYDALELGRARKL